MRVVVVAVLLSLMLVSAVEAAPVENYDSALLTCRKSDGSFYIAIRRFLLAKDPSYLLVDPKSLKTSIVAATDVACAEIPDPLLDPTPYQRLVSRFTSPSQHLQNGGAIRASNPAAGIFLTVDMCPSARPYELRLFSELAAIGEINATPVAIAVTKRWMDRHQSEMLELISWMEQKRLQVTWINHSDTHPFDPRQPLHKTFLLTPGIDVEREILATEIALIERDLLPSIFFRFPGLVSNGRLMGIVRRLGLIPLGSDAWLAKGEKPLQGSIVLVHGNGNEPRGVDILLGQLKTKGLPLLPLAAAFSDPEPVPSLWARHEFFPPLVPVIAGTAPDGLYLWPVKAQPLHFLR